MKQARRFLATLLIVAALVGVFCALWIAPRHTVPILMYHRFGYEEGNLFVTPENFRRQMDYLDDAGYEVVPLDEVVQGIREGRKFSRRTVVITVDDGYRDNFVHAYPVLKRHEFPAAIFLVAGEIGNNTNFLNWEEVL